MNMNPLFQAAISNFEAKRDEAIATLDVYFNKTVGIGEHSDLLVEINKWTEVLANANDCLEDLHSCFNEDGSPK